MSAPQLSTFRVGDLLVGLDVHRVQEVVRGGEVTPVPLAPAGVLGLLTLRGRVAAVVDARHRLGLPARPAGGPAVNVVVRTHHELVSIVVDEEGDVVDVDEEAFEEVPGTVTAAVRRVATAACRAGGALVLALDPDRLLSVETG